MRKLILILLFPCLLYGQRDINGKRVYGKIHLNDGSSTLPAFSFYGDGNSGMLRLGADSVAISVGDSLVLIIGQTGLNVTGQIWNYTDYRRFQVSIDCYSLFAADTSWVYENNWQTTMTLDSIFVSATSDNQDINIVKRDRYGGNVEVVDAITASTNGVGEVFTDTQTTLTTNSIAAGDIIGFTKPSIASENVLVVVYYHLDMQKR